MSDMGYPFYAYKIFKRGVRSMDITVFIASHAHTIIGFVAGALMWDAVSEVRPKTCVWALACFVVAVCLAIT